MKKVVIIDGQGGKIGRLMIEAIRACGCPVEIIALGTNSIATASMLKAGADAGATGAHPAAVACRDADVIIGPVGIVIADSLLGEVTPEMAVAIGQSPAKKILLPINRCNNFIVGVREVSIAQLVELAMENLLALLDGRDNN